jgi:hypothetical protein
MLEALKLRQLAVGVLDGRRRFVSAAAHGQRRAGLGAGCRLHRHYRACRYVRLLLNGGLQIFGVQVHPCRCHDHLALAPHKAQFPARLRLGQVASGQPLVVARLHRAALPTRVGDHRPPH